MPSPYLFADPRLGKLDGFAVEIDEAHERADIVLNRPPYNVVSMPQRDQLRLLFETLDERLQQREIRTRIVNSGELRSRTPHPQRRNGDLHEKPDKDDAHRKIGRERSDDQSRAR